MTKESAEKQQRFTQKMIDVLNHGAMNLAMAIGYRTGLFDVMATFETPQGIDSIARKSALNARYIREWLGIMSTGGVVEISRENEKGTSYYLPREHAAVLTRASGNSNLAIYTQEIPLLTTCAMEHVIDGFGTGEGIPYSCYPRFQAFMTELSNAKHRQVLIEKFLPSVDDGQMVARLGRGIRVCDFGCGEGVALLLMAESFPNSRFLGIDISEEAIGTARREATKLRLNNVELMIRDAASIKDDPKLQGSFHYVTAFDAIHDQTAPLPALQSVRHMLTGGGLFSMIDIAAKTEQAENLDHPMGPFLYTVSLMHCMPVGLHNGGTGLGMMWGEEKAVAMLYQAGFDHVEVIKMAEDPFNLHYLCRT